MLTHDNIELPNYEILGKIAQGGMGHVFRARHLGLRREVAIKFMDPTLIHDEVCVERFLREARILAQLNHPNIVQVFDTGTTADNTPYFVMEFLDGISLDDKLKDGPAPLERAISICHDVLSALQVLHERGVRHRDIKPGNIRLCLNGDVKLLDFGIARNEMLSTVTHVGKMVGTPAYMSPEQAEGKPIGPQSDIYSTGIVLYQLLTGEVPFKAETPIAVCRMHLDTPVPKLPSDVPGKLRAVVMRALEKSPAKRFQSAVDMQEGLKWALKELQNSNQKKTPPPVESLKVIEPTKQKVYGTTAPAKVKRKTSKVLVAAFVIVGLAGAWYGLDSAKLLPPYTRNQDVPGKIPNTLKTAYPGRTPELRVGETKLVPGKVGVRTIVYKGWYLSRNPEEVVPNAGKDTSVPYQKLSGTRTFSICNDEKCKKTTPVADAVSCGYCGASVH